MIRGRERLRRAARIAPFLVAAVVAGALLDARDTGAAPGPWSFPHAPHLKPETVAAARAAAGSGVVDDKDCRVCHDYATAGDRHDVTRAASCDACHLGEAYLEVKLDTAERPERRAFPHAAHMKDATISCFTCHALLEDQGWIEFSIPADGFGTRGRGGKPGGANGTSTCADCHAEHVPKGGTVKHYETTGDGKACATCHGTAASILPLRYRAAARAAGPRPFLHANHGGARADCETCHAEMATSRTVWDSRPVDAAEEACRTCHVGATFSERESPVPFVQFERFAHVEHLNPAGEIATTHEGTPDCGTCHFPEAGQDEPVGRGALLAFDACVRCHDAWRVEGHGVGAWSCFKCHAGDVGEDGRLATTRVERPVLGEVRFLSVHHPAITARGPRLETGAEPAGKRCEECHVADLETLQSGLGARFAHGPHLPETPAAKDCLVCHASMATARRSADASRYEPFVTAPPAPGRPDARGCFDCHLTSDLGGSFTASASERDVPEFDHAGHVRGAPWKGGEGIACTECHDAGSDLGYTLPEDVVTCKRCHSHDEQQPEKRARTGSSTSTGDATACKHCHASVGDGTGFGAPAGSDEASRRRTRALLVSGSQFHDKTGACANCHHRDARAGAEPWAYRERITSTRPVASIHDDPEQRAAWFNDPGIQDTPDAQGRTCATCHRREPDGYLRALEQR